MAADTVSKNRAKHPAFPLVARAVCQFGDGNTLRLYVSDLTAGGAFILAMKPPRIGEKLTVTLYPLGSPPLPTVEARVIGVRIDPADASRTGFEVVFSSMDETTCRRLALALDSLDRWKPPPARPQARQGAERRVYPRVQVDLKAHVELADAGTVTLDVQNISMSGAMLLLGNKPLPPKMAPVCEIELHLISSGPPEHICVKAQVVRLSLGSEPSGAGVKFLDVDELTARRIEGLILDALTGERSWLYHRDSGQS
jgi:c-di-GMP-binding flagellar brake protein YcgR